MPQNCSGCTLATNKPKVKVPVSTKQGDIYEETRNIVKANNLHTVCEEAACPNIHECWAKKHASFMILGSRCTRKCTFCHIASGAPESLDPAEPINTALAVSAMNLRHVVITSVDRDDLVDGGADHWVKTIHAIKGFCPSTTIEVLIPDFLNKTGSLEAVVAAKPDVINHNIETVARLYRSVRPQGRYFYSLNLLKKVKELDSEIATKSGFMLGLGETNDEAEQLLDDLAMAEVDMITIGQYLQPTPKHAKLHRYATNEDFAFLQSRAYKKGFSIVSASALTRSSYHADEDFLKLKHRLSNKNIDALS